jgi:hypothetical protein
MRRHNIELPQRPSADTKEPEPSDTPLEVKEESGAQGTTPPPPNSPKLRETMLCRMIMCNKGAWCEWWKWIKNTVWPAVNDMHILLDHSKDRSTSENSDDSNQSLAKDLEQNHTEDSKDRSTSERSEDSNQSPAKDLEQNHTEDSKHVQQGVIVMVFVGLLISWAALCGSMLYPPHLAYGEEPNEDPDLRFWHDFIRGTRTSFVILACIFVLAQRRKSSLFCLTLTTVWIQLLKIFIFDDVFSSSFTGATTAQQRIDFDLPNRRMIYMWVLYTLLVLVVLFDHRFRALEKIAVRISKNDAVAVVLLISGSYSLAIALIQNVQYGSEQLAVLLQIAYLLIIAKSTAIYDLFTWISCIPAMLVLWMVPTDCDTDDKSSSGRNSGQKNGSSSYKSNALNIFVRVLGPAFHCALLVPMYSKFTFIDSLSLLQISFGMLKLPWRWLRTAGIYVLIFTVLASQQNLSQALKNAGDDVDRVGSVGFSRYCSTWKDVEECEGSYEYCSSASTAGLILNGLKCGDSLCIHADEAEVAIVENVCRNVMSNTWHLLHVSLQLVPDPDWPFDEGRVTMNNFLAPLYVTMAAASFRVLLSILVYAYRKRKDIWDAVRSLAALPVAVNGGGETVTAAAVDITQQNFDDNGSHMSVS